MSVRIIVDSTSDVKAQVKQRLTVVPLTVHFGDREYVDGVTIDHRSFYEKLVESDVLPTTSQASPAAFADIFQSVTQAGDTAVVLTISSKLSGTCQSARIAAQDYPGSIFVVDSQSAAIGAGILAEYALQLADSGLDAAKIASILEQERERICIVALLDTLEYLKKGGRISAAVAFAGGLLSIKPVISLEDGEIKILGKARGSRQGNNLLVQQIEKAGGVDFEKPLLLGYTGLSDALLHKYMEDSKALWEAGTDDLQYTPIGSVIGTHAGPGAIAVAFFKRK
ncbi:MAG: DegV family protein [Oscillospiraceae bacterium]|nr:DegV family protein [Oscillospiraceae bacterium]